MQDILNQLNQLKRKRIRQEDIENKAVKQRHLEAYVIFTGLAASRPDGTTEVKAYFATDTFVLSIYTGSTWKSVTLS